MSVERSDYIMVCCNMLHHKELFQKKYGEDWEEELNLIEGLDVVFDGMSGDYLMVGKIINEFDEVEGINATIDFTLIDALKVNVGNTIMNKFGIHTNPELLIFTHWY